MKSARPVGQVREDVRSRRYSIDKGKIDYKAIDHNPQIRDLLSILFCVDSATRIPSDMIGNIPQDARWSQEPWHIVSTVRR